VNEVESITGMVLPLSLKNKVINDANFELGYHEMYKKDGTENYYVMFGDPIIDGNYKYNPIVIR